jgi:hypothetical protein
MDDAVQWGYNQASSLTGSQLMYPTRVFILASRPLFAQGVESLLSGQPGIHVIGVATVDPDVFVRVQAAAPDVVIVEAEGGEQSFLVAQILASNPSARVVGLSLDDNRIHTYYQQMKQGRRVEDLLEAICEPVDWHGLSPEALHLFVLYQGSYGQRILDNIERSAPETWTVVTWHVPTDLPSVADSPTTVPSPALSMVLPDHLPASDLVLSLGESEGAAQLLPDVVERTGARSVIAPVDDTAWLSDSLVRQLRAQLAEMGVTAVFPKPFCSLAGPEIDNRGRAMALDDPWIAEFARYFGCPVFRIECNDQWVITVDVKRDAPCGCARAVADQLIGMDVQKSVIQAGLLHRQYPCMAMAQADPYLEVSLLQISGDLMRAAVEVEVRPCLPQGAYVPSQQQDETR